MTRNDASAMIDTLRVLTASMEDFHASVRALFARADVRAAYGAAICGNAMRFIMCCKSEPFVWRPVCSVPRLCFVCCPIWEDLRYIVCVEK